MTTLCCESEAFLHRVGDEHACIFSWRWLVKLVNWRTAALFNFMALLVLVCWLWSDPNMAGIASDNHRGFGFSFHAFLQKGFRFVGLRSYAFYGALGTAMVSLAAWVMMMIFGRTRDRSISSWMTFTGFVAAWLSVAGNWHDVAWMGKQSRAASYVNAYFPIATALKSNWPQRDGERPEIGSYLAYPLGAPTSLILMQSPSMRAGVPTFNGVERTGTGGIAFQLIGEEGGDWLEWYSDDNRKPDSYVTGVDQRLILNRFAALGGGWYLVRYFQ